nr:gypsy/Ty3 retroelement polyprotein [Tanacetum cinerariifolium]
KQERITLRRNKLEPGLKLELELELGLRYEEEALKRFRAVVEDPIADLKNLRQTSTIKVYQDQFDVLLSKLDITESRAISYKNVASTSSGSYGGGNVGTSSNRPLLALPAPQQTTNSGIHFLSTLRDIKYNFYELRIEFKFNGKKVILRGTSFSNNSFISDGANRYEARATSAAPGIRSIWNSTGRAGGRPGKSSGNTFEKSWTIGTSLLVSFRVVLLFLGGYLCHKDLTSFGHVLLSF